MSAVRTCRVCGCTDAKACVDERGPCWWVGADLCSHCPATDNSGPALAAQVHPNEWKWYAGTDDERFDIGPCDTRDQVIAEALAQRIGEVSEEVSEDVTDPETGVLTNRLYRHRFYVLEAVPHGPVELDGYFDAANWFDELENGPLADLGDSDGNPMLADITKAQGADLTDRIQAVIRQWQVDHNITISAWAFAQSAKAEFVDLPAPPMTEGGAK